MAATAEAAYIFAIQQKIVRNWVRPPTAIAGLECIVNVRQLPGGEVVSVNIGECNGDSTVRRSIENAVHKASPLPAPKDPSVFDRNLRLEFRPSEQ
jgi:colicin import membrane protein